MGDEGSLHDLSYAMHVHSTYSDGTATVSELLDAARESAADALLLTDHDSIGARDDGLGGPSRRRLPPRRARGEPEAGALPGLRRRRDDSG